MKTYTAWHVGRSGEIAGGMTQVVNGYLKWPSWQAFELKVIRSRDGSKGLKAISLFAAAAIRILSLRDGKHLVIVHLSQGGSFVREGLLLQLAALAGLPTIAQLHGSQFAEFAKLKPARVRAVLSAASKVLVLSAESARAAERFVDASRVELIPNAVAPGKALAKERLVVFGGGVTRRKGVDVLVSAWRAVGASSGWKLVVAGPHIDHDVVAKDLPDASWLGAIPHHELMTWLDRSEIAVLPSRDEAMPMFILEAMARSNCVISTRVGGIPNVLSDDRGMLLDAGDVPQLAEALQRAMSDAAIRTRIMDAGHAAFRSTYSSDVIYPRMERLWQEVVGMVKPTRNSGVDL